MELKKKLSNHYNVKSVQNLSIKVDENERIVKGIANTYFWIDEDLDMLVTGCCLKSIKDRGVDSKAVAKIKHQSDHHLQTTSVVVKEIKLFEISVVSFGSNSLTPNLTGKAEDFIKNIKAELNERLDSLNEQLKVTAEVEEQKTIDLEFLQLKQIIKDLELK